MDANCTELVLEDFSKSMGGHMLRVNSLLVVNTILMGVMLGIGGYGHRYRHHPWTRYLFLGATTLFLPIISYILSTTATQYVIGVLSRDKIITGRCNPRGHVFFVLLWTVLVQIVGINTTTIVAVDPREGRNIAPPVAVLVQLVWTSYLTIYTAGGGGQEGFDFPRFKGNVATREGVILVLVFSLIIAKTNFNYYAFYQAGRSFALGSNPRFVVWYMEKLQGESRSQRSVNRNIPPPLTVIGEDVVHRKNQPHGYCIRWIMSGQSEKTKMNNDGLVTLDRVWQADDMILCSIPQGRQLKDLCFSFALFKLLRCRFARYQVAEADFMEVRNFVRHLLLNDTSDGERVLGMLADELSFLHDCYYSSKPISYSKRWLPVLGILISLLSIAFCSVLLTGKKLLDIADHMVQIECNVTCGYTDPPHLVGFGSRLFDLVPVYLLLGIVILAEARDISWYICSNWTKVAIICRYLNNLSWQRSAATQKWIACLLRCRCKLVKPWADKMEQCSVLVLLPRKTPMVLLRMVLRLPLLEQKKSVKVPVAVKAAIVAKLRNSQESLRNGVISLRRRVHVGNDLLWECNGDGVADTLLVWHIATRIVEVRYPHQPLSPILQQYKVTATHLSRYCAYLVIFSPELLPDDDEWCKTLYKAVKKDARRVLAHLDRRYASTTEAEFWQLVGLLSEKAEHNVLKNGCQIAERLARLGEKTAWKTLADFWLEIVLYIAPSDHLDTHAEAVARGGELITLLWAFLTHLGIVSRGESPTTAAPVGVV